MEDLVHTDPEGGMLGWGPGAQLLSSLLMTH